jgi:hypothetical protein
MRRALLLLLLLLPSAAAGSGAAVDQMEGRGVEVAADSGILHARLPRTWRVELAGAVNAQIVDDHFDVLQTPVPAIDPVNFHERDEAQVSSNGFGALSLVHADPDAVLLVMPIDGQLRGTTDGAWTLQAAAPAILEESHTFEPNTTTRYYYSYRSPAAAEWSTEDATWGGNGLFDVYAWGLTFELADAQGIRTIRTGAWTSAEGRFGYREHNAFAVLRLDGDLSADLRGFQDLYADGLELTPAPSGSLELDRARGVIATRRGTYALDGATQLRGGAYAVHLADYGLALDVQRAPSAADGAGVTRIARSPDVYVRHALVVVAATAGLLVVLVVATRWGWLGSSDAWIQRAAWAREAGHHRRSALAARMALLADPRSGPARLVRGQLLAGSGRHETALRHCTTAWSLLAGAERAVAAFEASRLHALSRRGGEAARWLLRALEDDQQLLQRALREPDFTGVLQDPEFRTPMGQHLGLS